MGWSNVWDGWMGGQTDGCVDGWMPPVKQNIFVLSVIWLPKNVNAVLLWLSTTGF